MNSISKGFYFKLKSIILFLTRGLFYQFFANGYIQKVVSTLKIKLDAENDNTVSTLGNIAHINIEKDDVDSRLLKVLNSIVDVHNVALTLICHCPMS